LIWRGAFQRIVLYLSMSPKPRKCDSVFLQVKSSARKFQPQFESAYLSNQRCGKMFIGLVITTVAKKAGLQGHYTAHSTRKTSAQRMYQRGVPNRISCDVVNGNLWKLPDHIVCLRIFNKIAHPNCSKLVKVV